MDQDNDIKRMETHASSNAKSKTNAWLTCTIATISIPAFLLRVMIGSKLCLTYRSSTGVHGQSTELCSDTIIMKLYQVDGYGCCVLTLCIP